MTDTTERAELPHKLDTLIRALPEAPFREHLRSECQAQAERIKTLEKMREEADEVEGSLRQRIASLEAERDKLRAEVERLRKPLGKLQILAANQPTADDEPLICAPDRELIAFTRAIESAKEQQ